MTGPWTPLERGDLQQAILRAVYGDPPSTDGWTPWTWLGHRRRVLAGDRGHCDCRQTAPRPEWENDE